MKHWLLLSPILVLISACGNKNSHTPHLPRTTASDAAFKAQVQRTAEPDLQLMASLNKSQVTCEGPCPEGVAFYLAWEPGDKPEKIFQTGCTGFLIAPDIMATNSHCIPEEIKARPELCAQRIGFKMPALNGQAPEILVCSQLIHFSEIPKPVKDKDGKEVILPTKTDYAFVRVAKKSTRKALVIAREGVKDGATLSVFAADPNHDENFSATIRKRVCSTKQKRLDYYFHDYSDVVLSFGTTCNLIHGDSGAPAFDDSGKVAAMFFAFSNGLAKKIQDDAQLLSQSIVQLNPNWNFTSYFTNFSCLDFPNGVNVSPKPLQCSNKETLNQAAHAENNAYELQFRNADEEKDKVPWLAQRPSVVYAIPKIDYGEPEKKGQPGPTIYTFELKCLIPQEYWPSMDPKPSVDGDKLTIKYNEMSSTYRTEIDPEYRQPQKKVSDKLIQNEIVINISAVKNVESNVGTRKIDGRSMPFSTRWCVPSDYPKK